MVCPECESVEISELPMEYDYQCATCFNKFDEDEAKYIDFKDEVSYRCAYCGEAKKPGSIAWQVMIYSPNQCFVPTCSEECAHNLRDENLKKYASIVHSLKNQCFQKMDWDKYGAKY